MSRAGRAARARAAGERLLPHGRRPHAPLGAGRVVSERFRPVGRQRGAGRATRRAAVRRRSLPVRLDGTRARGAGLDHRRSPSAPVRPPPTRPAVPVLPDASGGRPDRAPARGRSASFATPSPRWTRSVLFYHILDGAIARGMGGAISSIDRPDARVPRAGRAPRAHRSRRREPRAHSRPPPPSADRGASSRGALMAQGSSVKLDDYREVAPRGAVDFLLRIGERLQAATRPRERVALRRIRRRDPEPARPHPERPRRRHELGGHDRRRRLRYGHTLGEPGPGGHGAGHHGGHARPPAPTPAPTMRAACSSTRTWSWCTMRAPARRGQSAAQGAAVSGAHHGRSLLPADPGLERVPTLGPAL